ncbi:MAG: DNA methyltransferase [Bacteroidales bacterium]
MSELLNIKEASNWASKHLGKVVTPANISYLINYGKITKIGENGSTQILKDELEKYYMSLNGQREISWKEKLGEDLNWSLSFDTLKESDTTKHVHRLHPYKGKFIPQLVEYFLDNHRDNFKRDVYFRKGDIVLDPFCGSGTTLVQANELGIHAVGIDVSAFNALISNCKLSSVDLDRLNSEITRIGNALIDFTSKNHVTEFEQELLSELNNFNSKYFPVPEFKRKVQQKLIDGKEYGASKSIAFLPTYYSLIEKYNIQLLQTGGESFLDKWFIQNIRSEIDFIFNEIKSITDIKIKKILSIILSRTMRSCRATTHADLATLKEPITTTYYCAKHGKICKPLFSITKWWSTYSKDTVKRLKQFNSLKTFTLQQCLVGDSRNINIIESLDRYNPDLSKLAKGEKIAGIFSSPPYVGLINYHEQHAYSYDLFGFERNDNMEIGPLFKGQGKAAQESYVEGVSDVLINCKKYLVDDYNIFLVSNDKYNLYPRIAERSGMQIVNQYKRPVLNRTEKDKGAYAEIIFHLKKI